MICGECGVVTLDGATCEHYGGALTSPESPTETYQWCVRLVHEPFSKAIGLHWYGPEGKASARWWQREKSGAVVYRRAVGPWEEVPPDA